MANYLQLVQKAVREIAVASGNQPSSVSGQTGVLNRMVNYVADAWRDIQNLHGSWRWMRKEVPTATALTSSGTAKYTPASWNITDFASWTGDDPVNEYWPFSIYLQATGTDDENEIREIPWQSWRDRYGRGTQTSDRPTLYAISPANEFCLGAVPDAVYVIRGEYQKTAQVLSDNTDTPECPARFHDVIAWRAARYYLEHDEANPRMIAGVRDQESEILQRLELDQLPRMRIAGGPLA